MMKFQLHKNRKIYLYKTGLNLIESNIYNFYANKKNKNHKIIKI